MLSQTKTLTKEANKRLQYLAPQEDDFILRVPLSIEDEQKIEKWGMSHFASRCASVAKAFARDNDYVEVEVGDCIFVNKQYEYNEQNSYILMVVTAKQSSVTNTYV